MPIPEIGEVVGNYEIHRYFGCQTEGGIRGSNDQKNVIVIHDTRETGPGSLFLDQWDDLGVLHYRGQGRIGDQELESMNKRLADSRKRGLSVYLFETSEPNQFVFRGEVDLCGPVYTVNEPDELGRIRMVLVFPLRMKSSISLPSEEPAAEIIDLIFEEENEAAENDTTHTSIQALLIKMGVKMGLTVWVARNDRSRRFGNIRLGDMVGVRSSLPVQFDRSIMGTVELIDVLWLRGNSIKAAFEIEHSTAIYSGLLRMADLVSIHPNINIRLFIVGPDGKRDRVLREITRPTFSRLPQPLHQLVKFISYGNLQSLNDRLGSDLAHTNSTILDAISVKAELRDG